MHKRLRFLLKVVKEVYIIKAVDVIILFLFIENNAINCFNKICGFITIYQKPSFLRMSLGTAFLLTMKSIVL